MDNNLEVTMREICQRTVEKIESLMGEMNRDMLVHGSAETQKLVDGVKAIQEQANAEIPDEHKDNYHILIGTTEDRQLYVGWRPIMEGGVQ